MNGSYMLRAKSKTDEALKAETSRGASLLLTNNKDMKKILEILFGMAALYSCLYILLASITLLELFLGLR